MPEAKASAKITPPKTKTKAKPVAVKEVKSKAPVPKVDRTKKYDSTGAYNPKAAHNVKSYDAVLSVLPATYDEMAKAIPEHTDFIGYLIRRGGIAPTK
jgi:hypothetical protein